MLFSTKVDLVIIWQSEPDVSLSAPGPLLHPSTACHWTVIHIFLNLYYVTCGDEFVDLLCAMASPSVKWDNTPTGHELE